jgi:hypothetical protein
MSKPMLGDGSEVRSRSVNLQQMFEKYSAMAREASATGDRIIAEGYYQHAEHYLRLLNEQRLHIIVAEAPCDEVESFPAEAEFGIEEDEVEIQSACDDVIVTDPTLVS